MICSVDGCEAMTVARGWCRKHYSRWYKTGNVGKLDGIRARWNKVDQTGECWVWKGETDKGGYGRFRENGRVVAAHRSAYEQLIDPIPDGMVVRHACDNPPCVNPRHLVAGTKRDNSRDMIERGRHPAQSAVECRGGHERNSINTRTSPGGINVCRVCERATQRRYKKKSRP